MTAPHCERCGGPCRAADPREDIAAPALAYDATAEWKKRALEAEAKLKRVEALPDRLRAACKSRSHEGLEVQGWLDNAAEWIEEALK
jgi:hypothetical protein